MPPKFRVAIDLFLSFANDHSAKIYIVLFHLIFLLYTAIQPKIMVLIDLFLLCAHDHSTETYGPVSFILSLVHENSTKNKGPH